MRSSLLQGELLHHTVVKRTLEDQLESIFDEFSVAPYVDEMIGQRTTKMLPLTGYIRELTVIYETVFKGRH